MSSNLTLKNDNWEVFRLNDNQQYFNQFIDIVKQLDNNTSPDLWTKWKNFSNQIVIETPNYYYKIYNDEFNVGEYFAEVREKLGEIYRTDFGILWNVKTFYQDGRFYQIEQREKLKVCDSTDMSFDDLMLNWSKTLKKLEEKLLLPKISIQLQKYIKNFKEVKLIRDCINKFEDYAITKDGNIVLLDDADWFLALVNENHKWVSSPFNSYPVITSIGERIFIPDNYFEVSKDAVTQLYDPAYRWVISRERPEWQNSIKDLFSKHETIISDNIELISSGEKLKNKSLYIDATDKDMLDYKSDKFLLNSSNS